MAAIFLLGTPTLWWLNGIFTEEGSIYLSILATGIISYGILYKKIKTSKKALEDLEKLKDSALNLESSTEGSFFDEDRFSHLVKSVIETEKDIKEMLNLTRKVINADSVTFFVLEGDNLVKKASAGDAGANAAYPSEGYLLTVIKGEKPVIQSKLSGDSSYTLFSQKTGSSLCIPVLDGKVPLGVITAISSRIAAFSEHEKDITVSFALQIAEILRKARNYIEIERFAKGFKSLLETSKMLSASLRVEEIGDKLVELVSGMVSSSAVGFFLPDKGKLKIIAKKGFEPEKESFYAKGTLFDLIIKNKQHLHFSRLDKKQAVYPFNIPDTKTFLGIPIISGKNIQGIIAVVSKEPDAISSFYGHLLNIIADQAALSITNAQLHKEVEKLAVTDGLTGLYNHKHFQERLNGEFQRLERIPHPISLMLIDLDYFKRVNDTYGHPVGDAVLTDLAKILRKTLRGIDIIARYGGEEFAAVLINTDVSGAKKIAERLRTYVMNTPFFVEEKQLSLTLSVGVAAYPHDAKTKDELISKADQSLYHAKKNGRNQVCAWKDVGKKV